MENQAGTGAPNGGADRRIQEALQIARRNRKLSILDIASQQGMSSSGFQHLAKRELGKSFRQFLLDEMLQKAYFRLTSTSDPIKLIQHECGILDASNFSRRIKKHFGSCPRALRRLHGGF